MSGPENSFQNAQLHLATRTQTPSPRPRRPGIWLPMGSRFQSRPKSLFLRPKSTQGSPFRPGRHWHAREGPSATYFGRGPARACRGQGLQGMAMPGARPLGGGSWVCTGPRSWRGRAGAVGGSLPDPRRRDLEPEGAAVEGHLDPRPSGPPRGGPCPSAPRMYGPPLASKCRCSECSS